MDTDESWAELQALDRAAAAGQKQRSTSKSNGIPTHASVDQVLAAGGMSRQVATASKQQLNVFAKAAQVKALAYATSTLDADLGSGWAEGSGVSHRSSDLSGGALQETLAAVSTVRKAAAEVAKNISQLPDDSAATDHRSVSGEASRTPLTPEHGATVPRAVDFDDDDDFLAALQRDISGLSDSSPVTRASCIHRLALALFAHDVCGEDDAQGGAGASLTAQVAGALALASASLAAEDDPDAVATATLRGTSHSSSVAALALVPSHLEDTHVAMDPAYKYSAHELSEVAAMIVGKHAGGDAMRREGGLFGGLLATSAGSSSITRALAASMGGDPLRYWLTGSRLDGKSEGAGEGRTGAAATTLVRSLLRALWPRLCKPLLLCLGDGWEGVRVRALGLMAGLLACGAVLDFYPLMPLLMPALVERAGLGSASSWVFDPDQKQFARDVASHEAWKRGRVLGAHHGVLSQDADAVHRRPIGEPSEPGRAALARCTFALVEACTRDASTNGTPDAVDAMSPFLGDVAMIAHALAVDTAPDVRVVGCTLLMRLCDLAPGMMRFFAVATVRSLASCGGLDHRHAKVRLATLDAVDALIAFHDEAKGRGAGTEAILTLTGGREANVVPVSAFYGNDTSTNYLAKLIIDGNPSVRLRFIHALGGWITRLPDRLDWWPYLLPYLLSGLGDPSPLASAAALAYLEAAGVSHETEHAGIIMERSQYGLDGDPEVDYGRPLPHPFSARGRPRVGVRLFVRAHSKRFLKPVLAELTEFAPFNVPGGVDTRARAASLLVSMLVFEEEQATSDVHLLLRTLVRGVCDPQPIMRRCTRTAARLVGRYLEPKAWLAFLLPLLAGEAKSGMEEGPGGEATVAASSLLVLWLCLQEAASRSPRVAPHLPAIVSHLTSQRLLRLATPSAMHGARGGSTALGPSAGVGSASQLRSQVWAKRIRTTAQWYGEVSVGNGMEGVPVEGQGAGLQGTAARAKALAASTAADSEPASVSARATLTRHLLAAIAVVAQCVGKVRSQHDGFGPIVTAAPAPSVPGRTGPSLNGVTLSGTATRSGDGGGVYNTPGMALLALIRTTLTIRGLCCMDEAEEGHGTDPTPTRLPAPPSDPAWLSSASTMLRRDDDVNIRSPETPHRWEGEGQGGGAGPAAALAACRHPLVHADEVLLHLSLAGGCIGPSSPEGVYEACIGWARTGEGGGGGAHVGMPGAAARLLAAPMSLLDPGCVSSGTVWESLLVKALDEYPAHSGWDARAPSHALLTQLLHPAVVSITSVAASLSRTGLPMILDLGLTLRALSQREDAWASYLLLLISCMVGLTRVGQHSQDRDWDRGQDAHKDAVHEKEAILSRIAVSLTGMPAVHTLVHSILGRSLPVHAGGGGAGSAPPVHMMATPTLAALLAQVLVLAFGIGASVPQSKSDASPCTPPPSPLCDEVRTSALHLACALLSRAGSVSTGHGLVSPSERTHALLAASCLLSSSCMLPPPCPSLDEEEAMRFVYESWRSRLADSDEGVGRVAACRLGYAMLHAASALGAGRESSSLLCGLTVRALVVDGLRCAHGLGLRLTGAQGGGGGGVGLHEPTSGDHVLGTLLAAVAHSPVEADEGGRAFVQEQGEGRGAGKSGVCMLCARVLHRTSCAHTLVEEEEEEEGALAMAKAIVDHAGLLAMLKA